MFVFVRAVTYATLFISLILVYIPSRILTQAGFVRPSAFGIPQLLGLVIVTTGAVIALWCILTFIISGKGTPAPFDPPRRLVIEGPYSFVRNPMYVGAGLALTGAALFYESWSLLAYAGIFFLAAHLFVLWYEEPALRHTFGDTYEAYCRQVKRWRPGVRRNSS